MIRGKFTGRNKRDNMLDSGTYILIGLREWVDEANISKSSSDKHIKYCDLLEVYNSMERDILRRTHNIFSTMKDESVNKYQDQDTSISFVDENTLKYQNMIKKMEKKESSGDIDDSDNNEEELNSQNKIITTNVKHVGKGVVIQSYDISDDEDDEEDDDDGDDGDDGEESNNSKKITNTSITKSMTTSTTTIYNPNKKIVYESENNINVDDI